VRAGQVLAGDSQVAVGRSAVGEDDRVIALAQLVDGDVLADLDVAEEAKFGPGRGLLVDADDRLDLGVVGGDAEAHQPVGRGQPIEHVDLGVGSLVLEHVLGCVEAGGAGPDDGDAQAACPLYRSQRAEKGSGLRRCDRRCGGPIQRVESPPERHRDTGEDRRVAERVRARLGPAELLYEVEELAGLVALEGDDELLVVEAEGVGGVDRDLRIAPADLDVVWP